MEVPNCYSATEEPETREEVFQLAKQKYMAAEEAKFRPRKHSIVYDSELDQLQQPKLPYAAKNKIKLDEFGRVIRRDYQKHVKLIPGDPDYAEFYDDLTPEARFKNDAELRKRGITPSIW